MSADIPLPLAGEAGFRHSTQHVYKREGVVLRSATHEALRRIVLSTPWREEKFLNEIELAEALGVSRTPVREAVMQLTAEGLIRRVPNKGAYVPSITESEVEDILESRALVEKWAASRVLNDPTVAPALADLIEQQRSHRAESERFIELDTEFHRRMVVAARNPVLGDFYDSLRDRQMRLGIRAITSDPRRIDQVIDEHSHISEALAAGELDRVAEAIDDHLQSTFRAIQAEA